MPGPAFGGGGVAVPVSVANGGTGSTTEGAALTALGAQASSANLTTLAAIAPGAVGLALLAEVAPVNNPASPYTVATAVRTITTNASLTVNLPNSGVTVGEMISVISTSASPITVTFARQGSDTIDGGTSSAVTVLARGAVGAQLVSAATWGSVQQSDLTGPRSVYISVVGGVLGWKEQVLVGSTWTDISAHAALTTDVDGGVTLSGTTYTIPVIGASTANPHLSDDKRYVAFTSCSASLQAMVADGTSWTLHTTYDSMGTVTNARFGAAVARTAGTSYDAATETDCAHRIGWTGSVYQSSLAGGSAAWGSTTSGALAHRLNRFIGATTPANGIAQTGASSWTANSMGSCLATLPDRLYMLANAAGVTSATCDVVNPRIRLAFYPWTLSSP